MKKIVIIAFLFISLFSCVKKSEPPKPAESIYLSGLVTDKKNGAPIDSVYITLKYNQGLCIGCIFIPMEHFYSDKSGKFNYQFAPQAGYGYKLSFEKWNAFESYGINLYEEYQEFNFSMLKPPTTIYISGLVTDKQTGEPIDSVYITLLKNGNFITPQPYVYTDKNGKFNYQFDPDIKNLPIYKLYFKKGLDIQARYIAEDAEYQVINMTMQR